MSVHGSGDGQLSLQGVLQAAEHTSWANGIDRCAQKYIYNLPISILSHAFHNFLSNFTVYWLNS
jgi:hypothetical protein